MIQLLDDFSCFLSLICSNNLFEQRIILIIRTGGNYIDVRIIKINLAYTVRENWISSWIQIIVYSII